MHSLNPGPSQDKPGRAGQGQAEPGWTFHKNIHKNIPKTCPQNYLLKAGPGGLGPGRAGPGRAGPGRDGMGRAGPCRAGPTRAGPGRAGPGRAGFSIKIYIKISIKLVHKTIY